MLHHDKADASFFLEAVVAITRQCSARAVYQTENAHYELQRSADFWSALRLSSLCIRH